jgi:1,4-alpha-glucan branching enzyme
MNGGSDSTVVHTFPTWFNLVGATVVALTAACGGQHLHSLPDGGLGEPDASTDLDAGPRDEPDAGSRSALGANLGPQGVVFRVWAPNATAAWVEGDFPAQKVAMNAEPAGLFSVVVEEAHEGTSYRFSFEAPSGRITRTDPYCRELAGAWCHVIDPTTYSWKSQSFTRPTRAGSVVYEMHIGSFAVETGTTVGTLASARSRLPQLAELGINVIELMPVQSFGGNPNGWGYNPQLYFAPKPTYGTAADLRAFVDEAHSLGIAVWLDIVINHTDGWKNAPLACFDGQCPNGAWGIYFFPPGKYATTPWGPRPNFLEPQVMSMLQSSVAQWLHEFHGDGFRWDSTSNIRGLDGVGVLPGGREVLVKANELTHAEGAFSVAEDLKGWDALTRPASNGGFGFDAQWDGFGYDVMNLLQPYADNDRDLGIIDRALHGGYAGDPFARLLWTENHDTVGNGGSRLPSRIDPANPASFAARRRSMLGAVLLMTTPGVPMIFMGQEALAEGTFKDPPAPLAPPPAGNKIRAFYKDLIALRRNLDGKSAGLLETGVDVLHRNDANKVIAYRRRGPSNEEVIVILNLRNKAYPRYDVGVPSAGPWRVRLDSDWTAYGDDFSSDQTAPITALEKPQDGQPYALPVRLGAYGAVILTR